MQRFGRHVMRGLATIVPPVLTVVILVWVWTTLCAYVLDPIRYALTTTILPSVVDIRTIEGVVRPESATFDNTRYTRVGTRHYIPAYVVDAVAADTTDAFPQSAHEMWRRYVELRWLPERWFYPLSLLILAILLYLAGRFAAPGLGPIVLERFDHLLHRVPVVRRVYNVVQQVSARAFSASKFEFQRVVAVEYPRPGVWCIGYVINEGLYEVVESAQEPLLTVFLDTWPVPLTGYTAMVKRKDTIPLDMSVEDALRYTMSGGIIIPELTKDIASSQR